MVTTGIKPRSQSPVHLFQPCAEGSTDLGVYQTYTSAYPFDTLVTGMATPAGEEEEKEKKGEKQRKANNALQWRAFAEEERREWEDRSE